MENLLEQFEYLSDVVDKIDELIEQAHKTRKHKEKNELIKEATKLMDAYQCHCENGGNNKKQFNQI